MVNKFFIHPKSLPFTIPLLLPFAKPFLPRTVSVFSLHSTTAQAPSFASKTLSYGPSLQKGKNPSRQSHQQLDSQSELAPKPCTEENQSDPGEEEDSVINEQDFARVFDLSGLRVPATQCFALESRIRGHLLNWPRIRNIARVPGDEVEEELAPYFGAGEEKEGNTDALQRRIYGSAEGDGGQLSPVLYREKLAKDFNSRGFVNFRNLAKISRPKKKKKKGEKGGEERETNRRKAKNEFAAVEVVEEVEGGEDWKGLLGDEFVGRRKWRGSTRLLLLDEKYADMKSVEELPQAIKAALHEAMKDDSASTFELVNCKLTLFYDYWQMNEILEALLPSNMIVPSAFETVGHIAHLNLKDEHLPYRKLIAKVILDKNKPKIQTVVNKIDAIQNDYRTMQLEVLAGNRSLVTMVVENGLRFHVDLATVYWNSRLGTERQRLLESFARDDVVCDVFSGVGPIAISAAKIVKRVYANDLNPHAVDYMERNSVLNKLERKIKIFNMDGRRFIRAMFASEKAQSITQVVMNLPNNAVEFLDAFRGIFRDRASRGEFVLPMIHVYGFSKASDPEFDFDERIRIALTEVAVNVEMRRVRLVAPGKWMLCASFRLPASVAYSNTRLDM
ncbi:hypothetical protein Tsubulata_005392 [Turnera subulata]|uniref:tRNA (guanine(37)-N1)-methyltransferase n=1 Tax=Turnera subulata TaxID=218843 RepID=A0A9Q0G4K6_9ROSI|nr:hypothetical protein Tsubulata_005392 [Turnera subulata]